MKEPSWTNITTSLAHALLASSCWLTISTTLAQAPSAGLTRARAEWPEKAPYTAAIEAFDAALTRAGWDDSFRKRLIASSDSAKAAVAEAGQINIPSNKVMIFYEAQTARTGGNLSTEAQQQHTLEWSSKSNENIHVFYLPPFNKDDKTKTYKYETYFRCCYDEWIR